MRNFKSKLSTFSLKLLCQLKSFFGWTISITDSFVKIGRRIYARILLREHEMDRVRAMQIPLSITTDKKCRIEDKEQPSSIQQSSHRFIIVLLYFSVGTGLKISYSVSLLSRNRHAHTKRHMSPVKCVLQYAGDG